jgi:hypothetical protein
MYDPLARREISVGHIIADYTYEKQDKENLSRFEAWLVSDVLCPSSNQQLRITNHISCALRQTFHDLSCTTQLGEWFLTCSSEPYVWSPGSQQFRACIFVRDSLGFDALQNFGKRLGLCEYLISIMVNPLFVVVYELYNRAKGTGILRYFSVFKLTTLAANMHYFTWCQRPS